MGFVSKGNIIFAKKTDKESSLFEKYLHSCDVVYIFVGRTDLIDVNVVKTTGIRYESGIFNKMFY